MKPVLNQIAIYPRAQYAKGIYTATNANKLVYSRVKHRVFVRLYFRVIEHIRLKTINSAI